MPQTPSHVMSLFVWTVAGGSPVLNGVTVAIRWPHVTDAPARPLYSGRYIMKVVARMSVAPPSEREVRDQIERITTSVAFRTSDRLKHFITFVASQELQGKGDNLKEYAVGVQVFSRETAFDPRTDPVVRVQARRLRARLERYYKEEGQHDEIVVDLPKGGYAPVFRSREVTVASKPPAASALQDNTVMVRPIADLSPDRGLEAFCAGLT